MIKIVYDHQVFSWQKYGGVSRYIYELATEFYERKDVDVKVLAMLYVNEYLKRCKPGLVIGFPIPYIPRKKYLDLIGSFNDIFSKNWLESNFIDIVHKTYYYSQSIAPRGARVVVTVHDMTHEKLSQFFKNKNVRDNTTSLAKQESVKRADRIICVSENTKKDLIEILDVEPTKISVIYHGYSLENSGTPRTKMKVPYIFYVGERGGYKNFQRLLQAFASSSQLRNSFNIICFGGGVFSQNELKEINALGLPEGKVCQVSGDDIALANYYQNASVFAYTSLYEGFGIPLLEAMSLHCPVACSNTSSMPEVVGKAAELFDPYDPESIADALEKVLFSSERADNLVKLGTERIKHFSWQACAEKTRQVYLSLL